MWSHLLPGTLAMGINPFFDGPPTPRLVVDWVFGHVFASADGGRRWRLYSTFQP